MVGEIQFDSEGGFRANGFHVPAEPARKFIVSYAALSRLFQSWGQTFQEGTDEEDQIRAAIRDGFGRIDTGSLLRIARAVEQLASLEPLLRAALTPAAARSVAEDDAFLHRLRLRVEDLIAAREAAHGPCPERVRQRLARYIYHKAVLPILRYGRYDIFRGYDIDRKCESDFVRCFDRFDGCEPCWPSVLPFPKRSRLRREYDRWMRRKARPAQGGAGP
jgi:hypothetical protein